MTHGFKWNGQTFEIDLDIILMYPELEMIYKRDKDPNKEWAYKELKYCFFIGDHKQYITKEGMSAKQAHEYALKNAKLNKDYKPDKCIQDAIKCIKENMQIHTIEQLLNGVTEGLNTSGLVIQTIVRELRKRIEEAITGDDESIVDKLEKCQNNITFLIAQAEKIPKSIETFIQLREKWDQVEKGVSTMRGGKTFRDSYEGRDTTKYNLSDETELID